MVFASDEDQFNSLLKEMQKTLKGLDDDTVLDYDMKCAKEQQKARGEVVKEYQDKDSDSSFTDSDASATTDSTGSDSSAK